MASQSSRALSWASLLLLLVGGSVGSPEAGLAAAVLAALCAVAPTFAGSKGLRIAGVVLLLASAGLALTHLASARRSMDAYRARVERSQGAGSGTQEVR